MPARRRASHPIVHRIKRIIFFPGRDELGERRSRRDDAASHVDADPLRALRAANRRGDGRSARVNAFLDPLQEYQLWSFASEYACAISRSRFHRPMRCVHCATSWRNRNALENCSSRKSASRCVRSKVRRWRTRARGASSSKRRDRSDGRRLFSSISGRREDRAGEGHARNEQSGGSGANNPRGKRAEGRFAACRRERDSDRASRYAVAREEKNEAGDVRVAAGDAREDDRVGRRRARTRASSETRREHLGPSESLGHDGQRHRGMERARAKGSALGGCLVEVGWSRVADVSRAG